jgi:UDP-GlcNAc:undecaprenyl-phosphate GlcNAc-1-phosphate transferase
MKDLNIQTILTIVITTFLVSSILTPFIKDIAIHIGALDKPNKRKIHKKPMPRLGGLAIFFGFLLGYMLFSKQSIIMNAILIGSFIIVLTGVIDDIRPLKPLTKFVGQILSALTIVFYGGIVLSSISAFGINMSFGIFSYPITVFFILAIINSINFIDGLDGLASGISSIFFLTVGIIAVILNRFNGLDVTLSFIMLGSTLGFLLHNFYPAKIFLGDAGSMFLGFMISVISLLGFKNVTVTSFIIPVLILGVPILDTAFAIIRRVIKGEAFYKPDKEHLHHQLLQLHFSHRTTVLIMYFINILFAAASIIYVLKDPILGQIIYVIILTIVLAIVCTTNIISQNNIKDKIINYKNNHK